MTSKTRQWIILNAIRELGGKASEAQIARKTGFKAQGTNRSLCAMAGKGLVKAGGYKHSNTEWSVIR